MIVSYIRNAINKLYLKCGNFLSLWENNDDNAERLWRINKTNQLRCARAERKSVLWIERMLLWHVKHNEDQYDQLLAQLFIVFINIVNDVIMVMVYMVKD